MPLFLLPAAAGLLLAAAFPRTSQAWLGWVAWIPLIVFVVRAAGKRAAFFGGWLAGAVQFFILLRWMPDVMKNYGAMSSLISWVVYALLVVVLACYPAAVCAFAKYIVLRRNERCLLLFPFVWIAMELLMSVSPFNGFPWLLAGYSQTGFLPVIQMADITGIYGVSFLLIFVNTAVAWFIHKKAPGAVKTSFRNEKEAFVPLLAAIVLTGGVLIYGHAAVKRWEKVETPFQAALLQGNIAVDDPYEVKHEKFEHGYARMADDLTPGLVDLLILPESSAPKSFQYNDAYRLTMENIARRHSMGLVLSNNNLKRLDDTTSEYFNSAFFLAGDGTLSGVYDKVHLVPFGEYVPYRKLLFFIEAISDETGGFSEGREQKIITLGGRPANAVICFEAVFPDFVRKFVALGSQVIVNLTNDGWYGISSAPYHHLEIARARAVENRRFFLRAANTGFSAVIEPTGRIAVSTGLNQEAVCLGRFGFIEEKTFYSRHGNVFAWLCVIIFVVTGILAVARPNKNGGSNA